MYFFLNVRMRRKGICKAVLNVVESNSIPRCFIRGNILIRISSSVVYILLVLLNLPQYFDPCAPVNNEKNRMKVVACLTRHEFNWPSCYTH